MSKPPRTNINTWEKLWTKSEVLTYIKELCEFEKLATVNPKTQIRNRLRQQLIKQAEEELGL